MTKIIYRKFKGTKEQRTVLHKHEHWNREEMVAFANASVGAMFAMMGTVMSIGIGVWWIGVPVASWYPLFCLYLAWHEREIHIY